MCCGVWIFVTCRHSPDLCVSQWTVDTIVAIGKPYDTPAMRAAVQALAATRDKGVVAIETTGAAAEVSAAPSSVPAAAAAAVVEVGARAGERDVLGASDHAWFTVRFTPS
jgi:hypothetical protein